MILSASFHLTTTETALAAVGAALANIAITVRTARSNETKKWHREELHRAVVSFAAAMSEFAMRWSDWIEEWHSASTDRRSHLEDESDQWWVAWRRDHPWPPPPGSSNESAGPDRPDDVPDWPEVPDFPVAPGWPEAAVGMIDRIAAELSLLSSRRVYVEAELVLAKVRDLADDYLWSPSASIPRWSEGLLREKLPSFSQQRSVFLAVARDDLGLQPLVTVTWIERLAGKEPVTGRARKI